MPFTEADLSAYLRLLTYLNYNATDAATFPTDVIQRHKLAKDLLDKVDAILRPR